MSAQSAARIALAQDELEQIEFAVNIDETNGNVTVSPDFKCFDRDGSYQLRWSLSSDVAQRWVIESITGSAMDVQPQSDGSWGCPWTNPLVHGQPMQRFDYTVWVKRTDGQAGPQLLRVDPVIENDPPPGTEPIGG